MEVLELCSSGSETRHEHRLCNEVIAIKGPQNYPTLVESGTPVGGNLLAALGTPRRSLPTLLCFNECAVAPHIDDVAGLGHVDFPSPVTLMTGESA